MSTNSFTGSLAWTTGRAAARLRTGGRAQDLLCAAVIVGWALVALALAYRVPQPLSIDVGSTYSRAYLRGFEPSQRNDTTDPTIARSYAFSQAQAEIFVPGAGRHSFTTALRFDGWRRPEVPPALVNAGTAETNVTFAPTNGLRSYHLLVRSSDGDLSYRITSNTFEAGPNDARLLGIPVDRFSAQPLTGGMPLRAALLVLVLALSGYALARRLALRPAESALLTLLLVSALIYGLLSARLLVTVGLTRWLVVLLGLHVALWPLRRLLRAIYQRSGVALDAAEEAWLWRFFAVGALLKLGGVLYPHAIIFDEYEHVKRMNMILDGKFLELYQPSYTSYMGGTVGLGGGQFPYSPLWYLVVLPFHFLGLGLPDATNGLSALLDVSKLFPIHMIARVTLDSRRGALLAAGLYNLLPMPYFLLSWGNYPTQFGLWALLLATAFVVVNYERLALPALDRGRFLVWVALMALAILSYTVLGVFAVTLFGLIGLLGLVRSGRPGWRRLQVIVAGMIVAELFCFAIYHVQFARAIVQDTLPALVQGTADRVDNPLDEQADARDNALANFQANNQFSVNHFTWPLLILSGLGGLLVFRVAATRRWWPIWAAWLGIFVLYTLLSAYVADMVLKHVFIMMPLVCLWTAVVLSWAWRRGLVGRLATLGVVVFLAVRVAQVGHFYLLVKRHLV